MKLLLILIIAAYAIYKASNFFSKVLSFGSSEETRTNDSNRKGNIRVDKKPGKQKFGGDNYKGGEYIDYEEID